MEYSEHDGVNLQLDGNTVEIMYWYNLTKAIISDFTAGTPFHSQTYDDYSGSARQTFSALCPSVLQHLSAAAGAHPGEKAVGLFPSAVMRVKCRICSHYKYPPLKILNTNYKCPYKVKSTRARGSAGQPHYVPQDETFVMPEGINRASRNKRHGFPLKDCGNDDFEAVICDFMVILQYGFNRKIYSAFALIIIYIDEYNFDLLC